MMGTNDLEKLNHKFNILKDNSYKGYKQTCYPGDGNLFAAATLSTFTDWFNLDDVILIHRQRKLKRCTVCLHHAGPAMSALLVHDLKNNTPAFKLNLYARDNIPLSS